MLEILKNNAYQISAWLLLPFFILSLINEYFEYVIISFFILLAGVFIILSLKKLLNEQFKYHNVDKLIYFSIILDILMFLNPLLLSLYQESKFYLAINDLASSLITAFMGFVQILIAKKLMQDQPGYQDLFPLYAKTLYAMGYMLILTVFIGQFLSAFQNPGELIGTLLLITIILIFVLLLVSMLSNLYYYRKIFEKAAGKL